MLFDLVDFVGVFHLTSLCVTTIPYEVDMIKLGVKKAFSEYTTLHFVRWMGCIESIFQVSFDNNDPDMQHKREYLESLLNQRYEVVCSLRGTYLRET